MNIVLYLPFPPTVNSYYSPQQRGSAKYLSKAGRVFRDSCVLAVHEQLPGVILDYRLYVEVTLHPPDTRTRDLDNYMKALLDAITHSGLWQDDSLIDQLVIYRGATHRGGTTRIEIAAAGPIVPHQT